MDIVEQLAYASAGRADNYVDGVIQASNVYDTLENGYDENRTETGSDNPKFVWYYSGPYQLGDKYANVGHHLVFEYGVDYGWEPYALIDQELVGVNASPMIEWAIQSHSESSTSSLDA